MPRLLLSVVMLVLGASLIATAAGNSLTVKSGGVFRVATTGPSVKVDPQVAYVSTAWWLEYATAAKLFNYPDKEGYAGMLLRPEVALGFRLSRDGKSYSFRIRKGFRFSDGSAVTASNFKYAIDRVANHDLASPGISFIIDPNGAEIIGARDVNDGKATHVKGVTARGDELLIKLKKADATFITKLAMPFFQATSTKLKLNKEIESVSGNSYPSAGPYYYTKNDVDKLTQIRRNPYWTPGPGRRRPRHLDGVKVTWSLNEETAYQQTLENRYDEGPLPVGHVQAVASRFGVNKTRFWTKPVNCVGFIAFNNSAGLFADNPSMRKAVNWVLNRTDYVAQAGLYAGSPWTHILPPGEPGSITAKAKQPYSSRSNLKKAKALAAGHFRDGTIRILYGRAGTIMPNQASIVRRNLIALGFQPDKIIMITWDPIDLPPSDWDLGLNSGWCSDYADPYDFFQLLLVEQSPAYFPNLTWRTKIEAAAKLTGEARIKAFGKLDLEIMRNAAPLAPMRTYNSRYFFSNRVDPRSLVYQGVYSDWSIPALALK